MRYFSGILAFSPKRDFDFRRISAGAQCSLASKGFRARRNSRYERAIAEAIAVIINAGFQSGGGGKPCVASHRIASHRIAPRRAASRRHAAADRPRAARSTESN